MPGRRGAGRLLRVAVVDDDDARRMALGAALDAHPAVGAIEHDSWRSACERASWTGIDVVAVEVFAPTALDDQLAGVDVISRIDASPLVVPRRVIAMCSARDDSAARVRAREAGAHGYVHRGPLRGPDAVAEAVLTEQAAIAPPCGAARDRMARLGITAQTQVNAGVAAAVAESLVDDVAAPPDADDCRARFNEVARLRPIGHGGGADEAGELPSLRQIRGFVDWATRPAGAPPRHAAVQAGAAHRRSR